MFYLGCDVGSTTTKTVILGDNGIVAYDIAANNGNLTKVIEMNVNKAISKAQVSYTDISVTGGTGMGEQYIPFDHTKEGIIKCLAVAVHWIHPRARTVVDIGGLSTSVISINENGKVLEYRTSDKCASGSGFFLKLAAQALELKVEDLGNIIFPCGERAHMGTQCAVFGESEIVSHINDGEEPEKIAAGINYSLGSSVATMINRLGGIQDIVATGGVAKNKSVLRAIEEILGMEVITLSSMDEQLVGALGAALCAQQRMQQG
jgi:(R)-2-hydroxyacyl-CoA dehydratese activating ATPase